MTNVDLFQVLATEDAEEQERVAGSRAVIAVQSRATTRFAKFVALASTPDELESRIALIESELRTIASESAEDYGYDDADRLYLAATKALGGGHKSDCGCGFCENKGKGFGPFDDESPVDSDKGDEDVKREDEDEVISKTACNCAEDCECDGEEELEKESSVKTAEFETGYQSETVNLPSADASGLGSEASPKIDKGTAGGLEAIDVGSVRNKLEVQDLTENGSFDYSDAAVDPSSPLRKRIDADKSLTQDPVGENTKTFGDQKNQADPVTSSAKLDNWLVVT
jgi:hypothetical protein